MKDLIDFNADKRKNAANSFENNFSKLMNNSVNGKTLENLRKRTNVRLVNNAKKFLKYVSKPRFVLQNIFSENSATIHEFKRGLTTFNKPIYVGFSILDLSKYLIYEFL